MRIAQKSFLYLILLLSSLETLAQKGVALQWEPEFSYTWKPFTRWSANIKAAVQQTFVEPTNEGVDRQYQVNYTQMQFFGTYTLWTTTQLTGGYGFRFNDLLEERMGREHRLMEQITFLLYLSGNRLANRFRAEQRFTNQSFINRWRYRLAYDTPLNGARLDPGEKYLITSNEVLFSFNAKKCFAENRIYVGIGWYFNDKRKLEAGLQYRLGEIGTGQLENTLWFTTAFYLNQ